MQAACEIWIRRLIDHSRNNPLLFYRDLKVGTLDLTSRPASVKRLLEGKRLEVKDLVQPAEKQQVLPGITPNAEGDFRQQDEFKKVQHSLLAIQRKAVSNLEEKGIETLFLALGMATWPAADDGRPYLAPVLLVPMHLQSRSRIGEDMRLELAGEPQANTVLLYELELNNRLKIDPEALQKAGFQEDEEGNLQIDPESACQYLADRVSSVRDFAIQDRIVLGNFQFAKMAMVEDLRRNPDNLATHPIIAALAGHPGSRHELISAAAELDPRSLDEYEPNRDHLILDADSSQQRAIYLACQG